MEFNGKLVQDGDFRLADRPYGAVLNQDYCGIARGCKCDILAMQHDGKRYIVRPERSAERWGWTDPEIAPGKLFFIRPHMLDIVPLRSCPMEVNRGIQNR